MSVEAQLSALRIAARLANGFVLDIVKRVAGAIDVQDAVLLAAIHQANLSHLSRDPSLQRRFATLSTPMDDDLRRPISISAIGGSLRMPFETARRRVARLAEMGVVEVMPRGVTVPSGPLAGTIYDAAARANYDLVRGMWVRLAATGLAPVSAGPPSDAGFSAADPPTRLVGRLSVDYALRVIEPIATHLGDLIAGLVLMDMVHANTEHLPTDIAGDAGLELGPEGFPADPLRRPVRTTDLARRLRLPVETTRRKVLRLLERDRCERLPEGYIVPARVLATEPLWSIMQGHRTHLLRLFATLDEYGVLALWRSEAEAMRGAA